MSSQVKVWGLRGHSPPQAFPTAISATSWRSLSPLHLYPCLDLFQSLRPSYLGNRVKSLIADASYITQPDTALARLEHAGHAGTIFARAHTRPVKCRIDSKKREKMQSNQPHADISHRREKTKLQSGTETALISEGDSDGESTEKHARILLHT